jgi:hypothetical protein
MLRDIQGFVMLKHVIHILATLLQRVKCTCFHNDACFISSSASVNGFHFMRNFSKLPGTYAVSIRWMAGKCRKKWYNVASFEVLSQHLCIGTKANLKTKQNG